MAIKIDVKVKRLRKIDIHVDEAFSRIQSVEAMADHFPKLERIEKQNDQRYSWSLEKIGNDVYKHRVKYTSEWQWHNEQRKIIWTPIKGEGNAMIGGECHFREDGSQSVVHFTTNATLLLPLPVWSKAVAKPIVKSEFEGIIDQYFNNVVEALM